MFLLLLLVGLLLAFIIYTKPDAPRMKVREVSLPKGIWLDKDRIYTWMLFDEDFFTDPMIDIPLPLPGFKTSDDGVQIYDKYSYDCECFIKGRYATPVDGDKVDVTSMVNAILPQVLRDISTNDVSCSMIGCQKLEDLSYGIKCNVGNELRKFVVSFSDITNRKLEPFQKATRNVGYFSNTITVKEKDIDIIHRYREKTIHWWLHSSFKKEWIPALKDSFAHWNEILKPYNTNLELHEQVWSGKYYTPDVNLLAVAPANSYRGVATTVTDFRDGTNLYSRVVLSNTAIEESFEVFPLTESQKRTFLKYIIVHELGHTLGLRHNFLGSVDNNSSYMEYYPLWYPSESGELQFFPVISKFEYDKLAIQYGYGGIMKNDTRLFQTDENVDGDQIFPQTQRSTIGTGLKDLEVWMKSWKLYRKRLFRKGNDFLLDNKRAFFFLKQLTAAALRTAAFLEGYSIDISQTQPTKINYTKYVVKQLVEFFTGDSLRLEDLEPYLAGISYSKDGDLIINDRPFNGSYSYSTVNIEDLYFGIVGNVMSSIFDPVKVASYSDPAKILLTFLTSKGLIGDDKYAFNAITILSTVVNNRLDSYSLYKKRQMEEVLAANLPLRRRSFSLQHKIIPKRERKIRGCH